MRKLTAVICVAAALSLSGPFSAGDTITLKSGQVLEGKAVESGDEVTVVLPYAKIVFSKDEVAGIQRGPAPLEVYAERAAKLADSDAAGHYDLGLYCQQKGLIAQANSEFKKTISADGDHAGARAKLGYVRQGDKWLPRDEYMAQQGYVLYKGRYVTSDAAGELAAEDGALAHGRQMRSAVRTLASLITSASGDKVPELQDKLAGMSDPAALSPLIEQMDNRDAAVRTAVLTALLNYREDQAAFAALDAALNDDNDDLRYEARAVLAKKQSEAAFRAALSALNVDDDTTVFRASEVLGAIGDVRAIPYLIEALSWTGAYEGPATPVHPAPAPLPRGGIEYVAGVRAVVAPGAVAYEPLIGYYSHWQRYILDDRGVGYDRWESTPAGAEQTVLNYEALSALQAMTGQQLRFDKRAWRDWYLANRWRFTGSARRPAAAAAPEPGPAPE
jgi:hypothetical protein